VDAKRKIQEEQGQKPVIGPHGQLELSENCLEFIFGQRWMEGWMVVCHHSLTTPKIDEGTKCYCTGSLLGGLIGCLCAHFPKFYLVGKFLEKHEETHEKEHMIHE
jgi:hypothetical protein